MGLTYPSNKICPRCGTGGYVWYLSNSEYVAKCINCNHYFRREDFPMCVLDEASKPITNADRIRGMTNEELVEFLAPYNSGCPKEHGSVMTCHDKGCYKCWEVWLKKEVKEE